MMIKEKRLCFFSLCLGLCIVLGACHVFYDQDELIQDDKVAFSPSKECENTIISLIKHSEKIDIVVFDINNNNIVEALQKAEKQGKKIRILTDKRQAATNASKVIDLYKAGINIRVNSKNKIEHNKFAVFDNKYVITGSYNWTNPASERNSENCLLSVENEDIIEDYNNRFEYLWQINTKKKSEAWFHKKLNQKQYNNRKYITKQQQKQIEKVLDDSIKTFSAKGGAVIVLDADSSQVLSMTSTHKGEGVVDYIADYTYQLGSVYMPFTVALGIKQDVVSNTTEFDVSKPLNVQGYDISEVHPLKVDKITLKDVLSKSSNIATAQIAMDIKPKQHNKFLKSLGFGEPIVLENLHTAKPILPDLDDEITIANLGYGFGIYATPLHVATAYAALVNGGQYHAPYLKKSEKTDGKQVISLQTSQEMREYLRYVVTNGSARKANLSYVDVMAKTGTVSKVIDGKYHENIVITHVVGNFEHNGMHYVVYVLLDEPQPTKQTYGFVTSGWNAVPTMAQIINVITLK